MSSPRLVGTLALVLALAAPGPAALANPVLEGAFLFHVTTGNDAPATCEDLVQYSNATGEVHFDLYAYSPFYDLPDVIDAAHTRVQWPTEWSLQSIQIFGQGSHSLDGNTATIDVSSVRPPFNGNELSPIARLTLLVCSFGAVSTFDHEYSIIESWGGAIDPLLGAGQAGVECAYCYQRCSLGFTMRPEPDPESILAQLEVGQTVQYEIDVPIWGLGDDFLIVEVTEPWLGATSQQIGDFHYTVTLTVDASDLAVGWHEGFVSMRTHCAGCTRVRLLVTEPVAVRPTDWTSIKGLFR